MIIVTEKILAEYGKVILELIDNITATEKHVIDADTQASIIRDKSNILETLQKLTVDFRKNGSANQHNECEVCMLNYFNAAMVSAKKDNFHSVAGCIKKALGCYNNYSK